MSYLIRNLTPFSNYEARVQARNDHGWNKLSSTFHFSTRAEGKFNQKHFFLFVPFEKTQRDASSRIQDAK